MYIGTQPDVALDDAGCQIDNGLMETVLFIRMSQNHACQKKQYKKQLGIVITYSPLDVVGAERLAVWASRRLTSSRGGEIWDEFLFSRLVEGDNLESE